MKTGGEEGEGREGVDMRNDMEVRTEGGEMTLFVGPTLIVWRHVWFSMVNACCEHVRLSCGVLSSSHVVCSVAGREMLANCGCRCGPERVPQT